MKNPSKDKSIPEKQVKPKTEPMDNEEEVKKSNDEKIDQDFPGYPHYPAKEDIMNPENHTKRVDINVENLTRSGLKNTTPELQKETPNMNEAQPQENTGAAEGNEADVTPEDIKNLESISRDKGEDEEIESDGSASAFTATEETVSDLDEEDLVDELERTGGDLDVPGEELDDPDEAIGEEDEENNYYSLGGDEMNNLEEDPTAEGY